MSELKDKGPAGRWLHRKLLPLHQTAQRRLHDLTYLFFELTQRCNLACRHCGSDCTASVSQPDLPAQSIVDVLEQVRKHHDASRITVALTGGEPLMYPDLFPLGRRITELGFPWGLVTNGWAWDSDAVDAARNAGMCTVTVSLDGLRDEHDWFRGRRGSFDRAVATLRLLAAASWIQKLDVVTCVHRRNLEHLDKMRDQLAEVGVTHWRLFTVSPIGRAAQDPELLLDATGFQQLMSWIETQRSDTSFDISYSESGYLGVCDTTVRSQPFFCRAGINVAGVMADGAILACPNIDRAFAQGNIHDDDFCTVWRDRYQVFRDRNWMRTGPCRTCPEWGLCQGNSFHLWDRQAGRTRICYVREFGLDEKVRP